MTRWIYLSPHFDDVVLSAGGMIWEQARSGEQVEVWTICAGDPPADRPLTEYAQMLHTLWEMGDDVPFLRSQEDAACCHVLGASALRYTVPDNVYRYLPGTDEAVVQVPDDNLGPLEPLESYLIPPVADFLRKNFPEDCEVVVPLALGNHRDHVLVRKAAERLGIPLWHYVDYPYVIRAEHDLKEWIPANAETYSIPITPAGLKAWQDGFACHRSQIIFLWPDEAEMRAGIEGYLESGHGHTLWRF
jgi:LmbE family N-acetylglucosaminyl deacetylase